MKKKKPATPTTPTTYPIAYKAKSREGWLIHAHPWLDGDGGLWWNVYLNDFKNHRHLSHYSNKTRTAAVRDTLEKARRVEWEKDTPIADIFDAMKRYKIGIWSDTFQQLVKKVPR